MEFSNSGIRSLKTKIEFYNAYEFRFLNYIYKHIQSFLGRNTGNITQWENGKVGE